MLSKQLKILLMSINTTSQFNDWNLFYRVHRVGYSVHIYRVMKMKCLKWPLEYRPSVRWLHPGSSRRCRRARPRPGAGGLEEGWANRQPAWTAFWSGRSQSEMKCFSTFAIYSYWIFWACIITGLEYFTLRFVSIQSSKN